MFVTVILSYHPTTHITPQATLAVAEALGSDITLRFTASGQPIFFSLESSMGTYNAFCALSTKVVNEARNDGKQPAWGTNEADNGAQMEVNGTALQRKRQREAEANSGRKASKRAAPNPIDNINQTPAGSNASASSVSRPRSGSHARAEIDMDSDASKGLPSFAGVSTSTTPRNAVQPRQQSEEEEPLFLPEASQSFDGQMDIPGSQVLRDAGLQDFERMSQVELRAMLEDDDEEMNDFNGDVGGADVDMSDAIQDTTGDISEEAKVAHYAPTQRSKDDDFRPLFDD